MKSIHVGKCKSNLISCICGTVSICCEIKSLIVYSSSDISSTSQWWNENLTDVSSTITQKFLCNISPEEYRVILHHVFNFVTGSYCITYLILLSIAIFFHQSAVHPADPDGSSFLIFPSAFDSIHLTHFCNLVDTKWYLRC